MKLFRSLLIAAAVAGLVAADAAAVSVTVPNYSFELGSGTNPQAEIGWYTSDTMINGGTDVDNLLSGWTLNIPVYRFGGRWNPSDTNYVGASDSPSGDEPALMDGPQVAFLHWGTGTSTTTASIVSTNAVTTIQDGTYTLSVAVGDPMGTAMDPCTWVRINILANGASVANYLASQGGDGTWTDFTCVLDNTAGTYTGQELKILLEGRVNALEKRHVDFDNVRLDFEGTSTPHPGDANEDEIVDLQDFGILKNNFGATTGATWGDADFNGDEAVDLQDFGILKEHFGHTPGDPLSAVPEPATMSLLALGALAVIRRKR